MVYREGGGDNSLRDLDPSPLESFTVSSLIRHYSVIRNFLGSGEISKPGNPAKILYPIVRFKFMTGMTDVERSESPVIAVEACFARPQPMRKNKTACPLPQ